MSRTRARAKGRRGGESEHFARIPVSVLESEACKTLEHAAFRILVILASQYRGSNNGTQALTPSFSQRFGTLGKNTVYRSLEQLVARNLLIETRPGLRMKNHFALYAIGWEPIDNYEGQPLDTKDYSKTSGWRNWCPEAAGSFPMVGNGPAACEGFRE